MPGSVGPSKPTPGVSPKPGRSGHEKTSLFEDVAANNVGSVFDISPSDAGFNQGLPSYGKPVRVLDITGDDKLGEMICVSVQQESEIDVGFTAGAGPSFFPEGPLVGMCEFGAGSGLSFLEFDIPSPTITPGNVFFPALEPPFVPLRISLPVYKRVNGVLLTLPASSLRVYVRNDAFAPFMINPIFQGPLDGAFSGLNSNNKGAGKVRVHATYGRRPNNAKLTRTIPICSSSGGGAAATRPLPGTAFPADQRRVEFGVPPYAISVSFPRLPVESTQVSVLFNQFGLGNGGQPSNRGQYVVPAGSDGAIPVTPYDTVIQITNTGVNDIADMNAVFELGI